MIEIAACMNDLATDAVWRAKHAYTRLARITRVWWAEEGGEEVVRVGFRLWDGQGTEEERDAWTVGKVQSEAAFREEFVYAENHVLNHAREAAKTEHLMQQALYKVSDCMDAELRAEGMAVVKKLITLAKRSAGYQILNHEWDEGCISGCCADTAEMGGDLLVDEHFLTAAEIEGLSG